MLQVTEDPQICKGPGKLLEILRLHVNLRVGTLTWALKYILG